MLPLVLERLYIMPPSQNNMSDTTTPIDSLPPEMLQMIWRHLSFFDLIRCQQVRKQ